MLEPRSVGYPLIGMIKIKTDLKVLIYVYFIIVIYTTVSRYYKTVFESNSISYAFAKVQR